MNKLIIIEGADGLGKSTQAKILAAKYNLKLVSQPSSDNCVGYLRAEAKKNPVYSPLERQLLIAISHTVDAFTKFKGEDIIMDRSYLSGLVYGEVTGVENAEMSLLSNALKNVYEEGIKGYDVKIVILTGMSRLNPPDSDIFEQYPWIDLNRKYLQLHAESLSGRKFFNNNESCSLVNITSKNMEKITSEIEENTFWKPYQ